MLMKLTTIMYLHESVNRKALKPEIQFFGLVSWNFKTTFEELFHEKLPKLGSK